VATCVADQYSKCRSAFRIGSPFEQILREAADLKASLIVMASRCYGWFDRLVYGSDAERVLRQDPWRWCLKRLGKQSKPFEKRAKEVSSKIVGKEKRLPTLF
jgi:hypothetical protein